MQDARNKDTGQAPALTPTEILRRLEIEPEPISPADTSSVTIEVEPEVYAGCFRCADCGAIRPMSEAGYDMTNDKVVCAGECIV